MQIDPSRALTTPIGIYYRLNFRGVLFSSFDRAQSGAMDALAPDLHLHFYVPSLLVTSRLWYFLMEGNSTLFIFFFFIIAPNFSGKGRRFLLPLSLSLSLSLSIYLSISNSIELSSISRSDQF